MENSVIQRLKDFLRYINIGQNAFEKNIGWGNGYIAHIKKNIGSDKLNDLINEYPLLNIEWLITGNGNMFKDEKPNEISLASDIIPEYGNNTKKYIQQLESENKRLIAENERKQDIIDSFMSGAISIAKKDVG